MSALAIALPLSAISASVHLALAAAADPSGYVTSSRASISLFEDLQREGYVQELAPSEISYLPSSTPLKTYRTTTLGQELIASLEEPFTLSASYTVPEQYAPPG